MIFVNAKFFEFSTVKIANITENGSLANDLALFIATYENQCLVDLLRKPLAKELIDSFQLLINATSYTLKPTASLAIQRLVNGYDYVDADGKNRSWSGIVTSQNYLIGSNLSTFKTSFIADYIHYHYLLQNRSTTAGSGEQVLGGENSVTVQNESKRIDSWNNFIFGAVEYTGLSKVSLYQFLKDNKADYANWDPNYNLKFKTKW